ncbi:MAG: hypothetical protein IJ840_00065 [Bacteroidales bacterium]|nr:hypothetical protein [Bacteroidales bacterium]
MKKSAILLFTAALASWASDMVMAQERVASHNGRFEPYGFFRTAAIFDTRDSDADSEDLFYFRPLDYKINLEKQDVNDNMSLKSYAITTRLGVNMTGYRYGSMKVDGKVETDFYLMNGSTASLRLRHAFVDIYWDKLGYMESKFSFRVGQSWHPMAEDLPYCVNVETGAPFTPFNWSPQLMLDYAFAGKFHYTAGALYPTQFLPTGPQGESENYVKYGLIPELYGGISFTGRHFTAKAGADFLSLKPRWRTTTRNYVIVDWYDIGTKVKDRLNMISPFVYLQFEKGIFKINAKSVFAQGGDHLSLMGGYAMYDWRDIYEYKYTPLRSTVSFLSFSVGRSLRFMCMGGYMRTLGSAHNLSVDTNGYSRESDVYYSSFGDKGISQMVRATPTLAYSAGKLTVAVEYNYSSVEYGNNNQLDNYAIPRENLHWVTNHRVMGVVRFSL